MPVKDLLEIADNCSCIDIVSIPNWVLQ